jgi:hypothetical protein
MLLGGQTRLTLKCHETAAMGSYKFTASLTDLNLGLILSDSGTLEVAPETEQKKPPCDNDKKGNKECAGGDFDIQINWLPKENWTDMDLPAKERNFGKTTASAHAAYIAKIQKTTTRSRRWNLI